MSTTREGEIQKADPSAVRIAVAIVACGALLGIVFIKLAGERRPWFEAWVKEDPGARLPMVIAAVTLLTAGPVLGMAAYMWHLGQRIVRAERYPPPGLRMVHDTLVVNGGAAVRLGRLVQTFAGIFGMAGLLLALFLWRLFSLLRNGAA
jgi:hypothetical protein